MLARPILKLKDIAKDPGEAEGQQPDNHSATSKRGGVGRNSQCSEAKGERGEDWGERDEGKGKHQSSGTRATISEGERMELESSPAAVAATPQVSRPFLKSKP